LPKKNKYLALASMHKADELAAVNNTFIVYINTTGFTNDV
jgi:hypothetical protein